MLRKYSVITIKFGKTSMSNSSQKQLIDSVVDISMIRIKTITDKYQGLQ